MKAKKEPKEWFHLLSEQKGNVTCEHGPNQKGLSMSSLQQQKLKQK